MKLDPDALAVADRAFKRTYSSVAATQYGRSPVSETDLTTDLTAAIEAYLTAVEAKLLLDEMESAD